MRLNLCGLVLATVIAFPALADEARNPAIEATIQGQITAFLADDLGAAFAFAAPNIKTIFGDRKSTRLNSSHPSTPGRSALSSHPPHKAR